MRHLSTPAAPKFQLTKKVVARFSKSTAAGRPMPTTIDTISTLF